MLHLLLPKASSSFWSFFAMKNPPVVKVTMTEYEYMSTLSNKGAIKYTHNLNNYLLFVQ